MINAVKGFLVIGLWIAAAFVSVWAYGAPAAESWKFRCDGQPVTFGTNSLTIGESKPKVLLSSSPGVAQKPDGRTIPVTTYEFEGQAYLVTDDSGDPDMAVLVQQEDIISCDRY